jgi:hypothetical protein
VRTLALPSFKALARGLKLQGALTDDTVIFVAIILSATPYIGSLGFYSDDWAFLHVYDSLKSYGAGEVLHSGLATPLKERPLHGLYISSLFLLFGLDPLPQHLVNTGLLAFSCVLLFRLLKDLDAPRTTAFSTAILFGMLPHITTLRVWYATFQIVLSLLFFLLSTRLELRAARTGRISAKLLALLFAILSLAAYETTAPLLVAGALAAVWIRTEAKARFTTVGRRWFEAALPQLPNLTLIAGVLAAKWIVTGRIRDPIPLSGELRKIFWTFWSSSYDWRIDSGLNLWAAMTVNFWESFTIVLRSLSRVSTLDNPLTVCAIAALLGVLTYWRIVRERNDHAGVKYTIGYVACGFVVFWLGYAVFFLSTMVHFAPASTGNRMSTPATIGVAMIVAGILQLISSLGGSARFQQLYGIILAIMVTAFSIHIAVVASFWSEAWRKEQAILELTRQDLARLPAEPTVVLDGVCPYHGPAIVFESSWDWMFAASISMQRTIKGDVAIPSLTVTPKGFSTQIYDIKNTYPFDDRLYVYRPYDRAVTPIPDLRAARSYLATRPPALRGCPRGYPAGGVLDW